MKKTGLFCIAILYALAGGAQADYYYVNCFTGDDGAEGGSANPKRTIQAAIDVSTHGDTIIVEDGIYTGIGNRNIDFAGKTITVLSENGPRYCIIDCRASPANPQRAFTFDNAENANSVLDGFTITNGYGWGAGIFCQNSSPTINNCIIRDNSSAGKGGAIACQNADPNINNCIIINNSALDGGGIYCDHSNPVVHNCTISHNRTTGTHGLGGGICCELGSTMTISHSFLYGNRADLGAGIFCRDSTSTQIINSVITGNRADDHGGALYSDNAVVDVINCTISDNSAQVYGGACRAYNQSTLTVTNCILWENTVANVNETGAEIALGKGSSVTVSYSDVRGGRGIIQREGDSTLNWDQNNIGAQENADPLFVRPGYWDPNGTSENTRDDFWVEGDYRLLPRSPGIDRGDNTALHGYELDIEENTRIINGLIDIGAFETGLIVTKLKIKAAKNRQDLQDPPDSFSLAGTLDATEEVFNSTQMLVNVGPYAELIAMELPFFKRVGDKPIFVYKRRLPKNEPGAITIMKFDLRKGTFLIVALNIDLSGLKTPVDVALRIGDDYYRSAVVGESVANGKKPVPMQLMMQRENSLRLYKEPKFKPGSPRKGPGHDYLLVRGGISVANPPVDLTGKRVDITWGTYQDYIPADSWVPNKAGNKFIYKKRASDLTPNAVALAQFDFKKCAFKIIIKNADIGPLPPPQNLTISFDGFEVTVRPPYLR